MRTILTFLLTVLACSFLNQVCAQSQGEIFVQQRGLSFAYYMDGRQISKSELHAVLDRHLEANKELKQGHKNMLPATLLSYAGGLLLGYQVTSQLTKGQSNWAVAGAGASMITLSLPFTGAAMKREQHAVYRYNIALRQAAEQKQDIRLTMHAAE
jgi:hypothetical protein